ncbi:hypothetical protein Tfer_2109 [Thermincola ferriacetica]|uniref:Uncharacterized protein n=1 Tax=Thermincola ferriacetica TaxID=281456 RepID=A0A0L6W160_9FIRM|nr:hypothetical protein [Thermincola ferriacetica]KNZ69312.1 hypothetical protein Tfer_2109 [Thermincola ferriacetica]
MECIEINLADCQNRFTCSAAIAKAEKIFGNKLKSGRTVYCAICDRLIRKEFRSAVRSFYHSKTLLVHPVHMDCVQDHTPIDDLLKNPQFIDMSALDFLDLVGLVDAVHQWKKKLNDNWH